MKIDAYVNLADYTTMQLGGTTRRLVTITSQDDIVRAYADAVANHYPVYILGGGSNTLATDDVFDGDVLHIRIRGVEVVSLTEHETHYRVGAGEIWDDFVRRTVDDGLSGIEALSAIPGTVGAAPVQNIGAYGQEVASVIETIEAFDTTSQTFVTLRPDECQFAYRSSIFRTSAYQRYIICYVTFRLSKEPPRPPFYASVAAQLEKEDVTAPTAADIRRIVIGIRADKLPDPRLLPNSGSFFKNAIIDGPGYHALLREYPDAPVYPMKNDMYKVSSGWLIEKTGLKSQLLHGIRVHSKNALVLINESAQHFHDLEQARDEIIDAVRTKFGITIEQEPLLLSASEQSSV
jgi:UDP-N-acetylmuramate dehydrogenase